MLKISLLFNKNRNIMGEELENSYEKESEIFRVLFLYEFEYEDIFKSALVYL